MAETRRQIEWRTVRLLPSTSTFHSPSGREEVFWLKGGDDSASFLSLSCSLIITEGATTTSTMAFCLPPFSVVCAGNGGRPAVNLKDIINGRGRKRRGRLNDFSGSLRSSTVSHSYTPPSHAVERR